MSNLRTIINKTVALVAFAVVSMAPMQGGAAGSATYALSPNANNKTTGTTFSISVYANSGTEPVNSAQIDMVYEASQLQYVGLNSGALSCSAFTVSSGFISIGCAAFGGTITGNQLIGSVSFKAVGSGTSTIALAQSSMIVKEGAVDIWNHASVSGTATITAPVVQPVVKKASTPAPAPATTTAAETQAPTTEEVKAAETAPVSDQKPADQPAAIEDDTVSVWTYLAIFLGAIALAAGIVYRDNLKHAANQLRNSIGSSVAPATAVAATSAAKKKGAKNAAPKKKPAAKKK